MAKDIHKIFKELKIKFNEFRHPPVFTVEEAEKYRAGIDGARIKNLFLRNKKGNRHYLVITSARKEIDLRIITQIAEDKKLGLASTDRMLKLLWLAPGSVSPFGLINDAKKEVIVLVDQELLQYDKLNFHPNVNTSTIQISRDDFLKFLKWSGQKTFIIDTFQKTKKAL